MKAARRVEDEDEGTKGFWGSAASSIRQKSEFGSEVPEVRQKRAPDPRAFTTKAGKPWTRPKTEPSFVAAASRDRLRSCTGLS